MTDPRRYSPAAERNKHVIANEFIRLLSGTGTVLEIASGTGEHAAHIAPVLPGWTWQPSDFNPAFLAGIDGHTEAADPKRAQIRSAVQLDVTQEEWPVSDINVVYSANMIHIAPWAACKGLIAGSARVLTGKPGLLVLYGPFKENGEHTGPGNIAFDQKLRDEDPEWGIRDLGVVTELAMKHGFSRQEVIRMPANNLIVVFKT